MRGGDSPQIKLLSSSKRRRERWKKRRGSQNGGDPSYLLRSACLPGFPLHNHFYGFAGAKFAKFGPVGVIQQECKRKNIELIEKQSEKVGKCLSISFLPSSVSPPSSLPFFTESKLCLRKRRWSRRRRGRSRGNRKQRCSREIEKRNETPLFLCIRSHLFPDRGANAYFPPPKKCTPSLFSLFFFRIFRGRPLGRCTSLLLLPLLFPRYSYTNWAKGGAERESGGPAA